MQSYLHLYMGMVVMGMAGLLGLAIIPYCSCILKSHEQDFQKQLSDLKASFFIGCQ